MPADDVLPGQPAIYALDVKAVWTCKVCGKCNVKQRALLYWSGTEMIGLICSGHNLAEIELAMQLRTEPVH